MGSETLLVFELCRRLQKLKLNCIDPNLRALLPLAISGPIDLWEPLHVPPDAHSFLLVPVPLVDRANVGLYLSQLAQDLSIAFIYAS